MVRVKICGITNWRDALLAMEAGADALGFNFYGKSPRHVSISHAREIVRHMPRNVVAVGVFVNASAGEILRVAQTANLAVIQMHGDESPSAVARVAKHYPVIKAFRVGPNFRVGELARYRAASAFLLDGFDPELRGGTGKQFDWEIARRAKKIGPVILAGGLRAENVAEAIRRAEPFAIDVCSGVEARPGKKDPRKMKALMSAARKASRKKS